MTDWSEMLALLNHLQAPLLLEPPFFPDLKGDALRTALRDAEAVCGPGLTEKMSQSIAAERWPEGLTREEKHFASLRIMLAEQLCALATGSATPFRDEQETLRRLIFWNEEERLGMRDVLWSS